MTTSSEALDQTRLSSIVGSYNSYVGSVVTGSSLPCMYVPDNYTRMQEEISPGSLGLD